MALLELKWSLKVRRSKSIKASSILFRWEELIQNLEERKEKNLRVPTLKVIHLLSVKPHNNRGR
jgi:hypothetical protein